ncbi:hypothetical protein C4580_01520 [Candidatus Woesearchaeota archaeon]|nr:MAG: hypothetical protein C4580_01520 [Candidatus Woesearchaeota archaeon]
MTPRPPRQFLHITVPIAIIVGLMFALGMRSMGTQTRGALDEIILSLFSLAFIGLFLAGMVWIARHFRGGAAPAAASAAAIQQIEQRFDRLDQAVQHVHTDVNHARAEISNLRTALARMLQGIRQWGRMLDQFRTAMENLINPIGASVQQISARTAELERWRTSEWPNFQNFVTNEVRPVLTETARITGEFSNLTTEVKDLGTRQKAVEDSILDLKTAQDAVRTEIEKGFTESPAKVAAAVKADLDAVQAAVIAEVKAGNVLTEQLRDECTRQFPLVLRDIDRVSTKVDGLTALSAGIKRDVSDGMSSLKTELAAVNQALADGTVANVARFAAVNAHLKNVESRLTKSATSAEVQGVLAELKTLDDQKLRPILERVNAQGSLITASITEMRERDERIRQAVEAQSAAIQAALKTEIQEELDVLAASINNDLEPMREQMQGIVLGIAGMLDEMREHARKLDELKGGEGIAGLDAQVKRVSELLGQLGEAGARRGEVLQEVHRGVELTVRWILEESGKLEGCSVDLARLEELLKGAQGKVVEYEKVEKKARERTNAVVKRQKGVYAGAVGIGIVDSAGMHELVLKIAAQVVNARGLLRDANLAQDAKKEGLKKCIKLIRDSRKKLCQGDKSYFGKATALMKLGKSDELAPKMDKILKALAPLCGDIDSDFEEGLVALINAKVGRRKTFDAKAVSAALDKLSNCPKLREFEQVLESAVSKK